MPNVDYNRMVLLIQYIAIYAPWIYAICGLVALYHIYKTWQVRSERRQALFSLEREKALRDLFSILFICLLLLFVMGLTYFSTEVLARAIQQEEIIRPLATPTPLVFEAPPTATPTETLTATLPITTTLVTVDSTPTLVPEVEAEVPPTETPVPPPEPPPVVASVCPDPRAQLTSPASGTTVSGQVSLSGSATHEQFNYYKLEYAPGANADDGFVYLSGGSAAVAGGTLGSFNSAAVLSNGTWTIRLVVVDSTGNFPPPCKVTINVQN